MAVICTKPTGLENLIEFLGRHRSSFRCLCSNTKANFEKHKLVRFHSVQFYLVQLLSLQVLLVVLQYKESNKFEEKIYFWFGF